MIGKKMTKEIKGLENQLFSTNHLIVCKTLKELANNEIDEKILNMVLRLVESSTIAIEKNALHTIYAHRNRLTGEMRLELLKKMDLRTNDFNCSYSCCGYDAYNGPIELYLNSLRLVSDLGLDWAIYEVKNNSTKYNNAQMLLEILQDS
jgi:hypothetical protein